MADARLPIRSNRCKCEACGEYFSGVSAFDRHQTGGKDGRAVCHGPAARGPIFDGRYWGWPAPGCCEKPWGNAQDESKAVAVGVAPS